MKIHLHFRVQLSTLQQAQQSNSKELLQTFMNYIEISSSSLREKHVMHTKRLCPVQYDRHCCKCLKGENTSIHRYQIKSDYGVY